MKKGGLDCHIGFEGTKNWQEVRDECKAKHQGDMLDTKNMKELQFVADKITNARLLHQDVDSVWLISDFRDTAKRFPDLVKGTVDQKVKTCAIFDPHKMEIKSVSCQEKYWLGCVELYEPRKKSQ